MNKYGAFLWLKAELARYRYKPGWHLEVAEYSLQPPHYGSAQLVIRFEAPDSREGGRPPAKVMSCHPIPPYFGEGMPDEFAHWLRNAILAAETHELDEWLRRDEVVIFDPHGDSLVRR